MDECEGPFGIGCAFELHAGYCPECDRGHESPMLAREMHRRRRERGRDMEVRALNQADEVAHRYSSDMYELDGRWYGADSWGHAEHKHRTHYRRANLILREPLASRRGEGPIPPW